MTVDHLKMLHTAGGKGKLSRLTVGQRALQRGCCVRGVRALASSVRCAGGVLGESEWKLSYVLSGIWDFLLLDKIHGMASSWNVLQG